MLITESNVATAHSSVAGLQGKLLRLPILKSEEPKKLVTKFTPYVIG